jgi:hypothetical protein
VLFALLMAGGVWFGRFAYLRITLRPEPRISYWDAELARQFPVPADALPVSEISAVLTSRPFESDPQITALQLPASQPYDVTEYLRRRWDSPRADVAATSTVLSGQSFADARRSLEDVVSRPWSFSVTSDPFATFVDYSLAAARAWAKWLVVHSYWAHSEGRTDEAVADWRLVFTLAGRLGVLPGVIPPLVAAAIEALVAEEMTLAAHEGVDAIDLRRLTQEIDTTLRPAETVRRMCAVERVQHMCLLEFLFVQEPAGWMDVSELTLFRAQMNAWRGTGPSAPSRLWNLASPLFHNLATARRQVEAQFDGYEQCVDMASSARISKQESTGRDGPSVLDGRVYEFSLARAFELHFRSLTCVEAALATLAIAQYHREHGQYPESLEELVPAILPRVPTDYADLRPLRYRRTGDDYLLYSIWSNGVDEGGVGDVENYEAPDHVFSRLRRKLEDGR